MSPSHSPYSVFEVENALAHYYEGVTYAAESTLRPAEDGDRFEPRAGLPALDDGLVRFFEPSRLRAVTLPDYVGRRLTLLDLTGNPATRTTKTFASLVIVARALAHIRATGERVVIVTPTSANKGTALRDAVLRALTLGLATPDSLQIVTVAPTASAEKLWSSQLAEDPALRVRNPMCVLESSEPSDVKQVATEIAERLDARREQHPGTRVWYTLALENYRIGDTVRAFFEHACLPPPGERFRLHAHAVSSAFGLLGYHLGRRCISKGDQDERHPGFFLVQHLRTGDMVTSLAQSQGRSSDVEYSYSERTGMYSQESSALFPRQAYDTDEQIDATFYTRSPPTSAEMNALIARHGGGGIIVSLYECLHRYPFIRALLAPAGLELPSDPRQVREWSLIMVLTGVLEGIDRGLIADESDVVVHGSGTYATTDYVPLSSEQVTVIRTAADADAAISAALTAESAVPVSLRPLSWSVS